MMRNLLSSEIIKQKKNNVKMTLAVSLTNKSILEDIKNNVKKYNVSHGSHRQHSSG